jgi:hypothetical protein
MSSDEFLRNPDYYWEFLKKILNFTLKILRFRSFYMKKIALFSQKE